MTAIEKAAYMAHARSAQYLRRVDEARRIVDDMPASTPVVAFSGGKDSSVMLHLVRTMRPKTTAIWSDDEFNLPETLAILDKTPDLISVAGKSSHTEWFTTWADGPPSNREWYGDDFDAWIREHGYDGVFVGIRADENNYRRVHLRTRGTCIYAKSRGLWQCYPVAWWSTRDIWAYIVVEGLSYNAAYDRLSAIGVSVERQRIGPFVTERALGFGQLAVLRAGWPREYERFAARFKIAGRES